MRPLVQWTFLRVMLIAIAWMIACSVLVVLIAVSWVNYSLWQQARATSGSGGIGAVSIGVPVVPVLFLAVLPALLLVLTWVVMRVTRRPARS